MLLVEKDRLQLSRYRSIDTPADALIACVQPIDARADNTLIQIIRILKPMRLKLLLPLMCVPCILSAQTEPDFTPDDPPSDAPPVDQPIVDPGTPPSDDIVSDVPNIGDKLQAIATRALSTSGAGVLTNGFIIEGSGTKTVVIAAKGPSFQSTNVPDTLEDPFLRLYQFNSETSAFDELATNDNWETGLLDTDRSFLENNNFTPTNSLESVIVISLSAGVYTAEVSGRTASDEGVGLAEVYDFDTSSVSKITALATRVFAGNGGESLNGGFIIAGDSPRTVAVRAVGPSLEGVITDPVLGDPSLQINEFDSTTSTFVPISGASNDNWETGLSDADRTVLTDNNFLPTNSLESVLVLQLDPGVYTGVVSGADGGTGIALIEVYDFTTE